MVNEGKWDEGRADGVTVVGFAVGDRVEGAAEGVVVGFVDGDEDEGFPVGVLVGL